MFGAARTAPLTPSGPRPVPVVFSLVAHAGVLSFVVFGPRPHLAERQRSLYEQEIKPQPEIASPNILAFRMPAIAPPPPGPPRKVFIPPPPAPRKPPATAPT